MANEEFKNDALLVAALKYDSHEAFVKIFRQYYANLVRFTARFIPDKSTCEDIVQEAFIRVWTNRKKLETDTSIRSYLISLVQNLALNELRHQKVKKSYQDMNHETILSLSPDEHLLYSELSDAYETALSKLDPDVRETLMLSRQEKLKYSEIAQRLNISVRTVEARISKAIKFLHQNLQIYKSLIFIILSARNLL
ncbi:MAG: RNA polymerase sigma-70 factor [Muribaculaceae bacterium]|nr:RNA polymerase sigma-70 factor [Muribaculaceae bacterium]